MNLTPHSAPSWSFSVTRDSSGRHSLKRMRGTARYISVQGKLFAAADLGCPLSIERERQ